MTDRELLFCALCGHDEYDHDEGGECFGTLYCSCPGFEAEVRKDD